mmetsp:Transcript_15447/g.17191  ORF Transcript_15447/g.17191 Transcript_15447/m.17191 type:complete len:316 (+) Transcript_15447:159-1106(+)
MTPRRCISLLYYVFVLWCISQPSIGGTVPGIEIYTIHERFEGNALIIDIETSALSGSEKLLNNAPTQTQGGFSFTITLKQDCTSLSPCRQLWTLSTSKPTTNTDFRGDYTFSFDRVTCTSATNCATTGAAVNIPLSVRSVSVSNIMITDVVMPLSMELLKMNGSSGNYLAPTTPFGTGDLAGIRYTLPNFMFGFSFATDVVQICFSKIGGVLSACPIRDVNIVRTIVYFQNQAGFEAPEITGETQDYMFEVRDLVRSEVGRLQGGVKFYTFPLGEKGRPYVVQISAFIDTRTPGGFTTCGIGVRCPELMNNPLNS